MFYRILDEIYEGILGEVDEEIPMQIPWKHFRRNLRKKSEALPGVI